MKSNRKAGVTGRRERRAFSAEFKAEAVRLVAERRALGVTLAQVGRELDVRPDQLRRWTREQRQESGTGSSVPGETLEQENRRLRREVDVLRQEQAFAKKVAVYFAKESR
jgi:transposase